MQKYVFVFLVIAFASIVSAAESVDFDCPDEIRVNEEFECSLEIAGAQGTWDVKVEILEKEKTIAKIYNPETESFKSAYYYLNEFITEGEEKQIRLILEQEGEFDGTLKLRQESTTKTFPFEIEVQETDEPEEEKQEQEEQTDDDGDKQEDADEESRGAEEEIKGEVENNQNNQARGIKQKKQTISLNSLPSTNVKNSLLGETVYESKNAKILKVAPYAFSVFLLGVIGLLLREKF